MPYNFIPEDVELYSFKCNQHVLVQKEFIKYVRGFSDVTEEQYKPPDLAQPFPLVNSYYEFAEDYDAVNRIPHLLYEQCPLESGDEPSTATTEDSSGSTPLPPPKKTQRTDHFVERKAQIEYLRAKPKCFVILGKPGLGEERLGKLLADYWRCVLINPEVLIQEEIRSGSRAGLCIEFNLRCGRSISVDVIMRLLEKCLSSEIVKHRGFVLCGFPLIANDLFSEDPVSSESAIFNVHEIFEEIVDNVVAKDTVKHVSRTSVTMEFEAEEETALAEEDVTPVLKKQVSVKEDVFITHGDEPICFPSKYYDKDSNQMEFVLSLCEEHNYCIVYLKCANEEVVNIRQDTRYDCQTLQQLSVQRERDDNIFYTLYNMYQDQEENFVFDDATALNQRMVKMQRDFTAHVRVQLERYLLESQLVIEKYILLKDPEDIIRLDGRMSPHRLFQVLRMRLKVLPFAPAILPNLVAPPAVNFDDPGERNSPKHVGSPSVYDEVASEDIYLSMRSRKALGPLYMWNLSEWKYLCPVAMKEGYQAVGNGKYAVHFMNNIFFLSNEKRCDQFLDNPRPYLLPPMPITFRRVFIIGPPSSGKTAIAKCIQHFNNAEIIDCRKIKLRCLRRKMYGTVSNAEQDAIRKALEYMKEQRRLAYFNQETDRLKKLKMYMDCIRKSLEELQECLILMNELTDVEFTQFPALSMKERTEKEVKAEATLIKFAEFQALFGIETPEDCDKYLNDESLIMKYLPEDFQEPIMFTYLVIGPCSDSVLEYAQKIMKECEDALMGELEDFEEIAKCINAVLDDYQNMIERGKISGWILDGFPPDTDLLQLIEKRNMPDITYVFCDTTGGESLLNIGGGNVRFDDNILKEVFRGSGSFGLPSSSQDFNSFTLSDLEIDVDAVKAVVERYLLESLPKVEACLNQLEYKFEFIDVGALPFKELLAGLIDNYKSLYSYIAREVTPEEKKHEPTYYGDYGDIESGEFGGEDAEDALKTVSAFRENRRLGNTSYYDPVAYNKHGLLWLGKEDFLVNYMNKMWLFATEEMMNMFIKSPDKYSEHVASNHKLPPPRICLVGKKNVGKSTQTTLLCKWLGLFNFDLVEELKNVVGEDGAQDHDLDDAILRDMLLPFWHDPNKKAVGFVMNNFPRKPSDFKFMLENFVIPDCIVELHMDSYALNARLVDILLREWRTQIGTEREFERQRHEEELDIWQVKRDIEKARLLDERRQDHKYYGEDDAQSENVSLLSYKSYQEAQDEKEVEAFLQENFPPPVLLDNWETEENATERLRQAAEENTEADPTYLNEMMDMAEQHKIPWHTVDANMEEIRVYNLLMQYIMPYLFRNSSFLERAYDISIEMAERLLEHGYYFLSRFGKTCPVQMYERYNPLQMYITKEAQFQLFPMIYSNYIYFLAGTENREKFKKDILKYIQQNYQPLPLVRARIALIGPPHSGKTTVAERMSLEYSLEHISIGKAVRRVLKFMPSSILAQKLRLHLEKGEELPDDLSVQCAEAMTFEAKAVALGYVMDGCPNSIDQVKLMAQMNLVPHVIIDLSATLDYIFKHLDTFESPYKPAYSKQFLKYRFDDWLMDKDVFRQWLDREYQNMATVSVEPSRWSTWSSVREIMLAVIYEIKHYYRHCDKDMALRVANMLVTPHEFLLRQSAFKSYCPLCLYYENALTFGCIPPDRTGLMSYHGKFYWMCSDHVNEFEDDPDKFLGSNIVHTLPAQLPQVIELSEFPENVFLFGYCAVCIAQSLPDMVYNMGSLSNGVQYGEQIYMFDQTECMSAFMKTPQIARNLPTEKPTTRFAACDIQSLPTLGMLEQYVSAQVIKALIEVEKSRPLIAGLSISQSAIVCLGLILKINNPNTPERNVVQYKKAKNNTMDAQVEMRRLIKETKQTLNPYIHYQEPLPPFKLDLRSLHKESTDTMYIKDIIDTMLDRIEYDERLAHLDIELSSPVLGG